MSDDDILEERVSFEVGDSEVVGTLRRRVADADRLSTGVVFLGPLTSVKEQVPGNYARALAERGFTTLAIDNRYFGESEGEPRQYEHPQRKVEDVRAAADFLGSQVGVDEVSAVGICAGAGYMSGLVADNPDVSAFAVVAGFFHDAEKQREWMGDDYEAALERAREARERWEADGECEYIPAVGEDGEVAMPMHEAYIYYGTERGAVPNYVNRFALMSREQTLTWDAQANAARITAPTLMIHSENALAPTLARKFYDSLAGPKEQVWMESEGQIDFYDDVRLIDPVADRIAGHFSRR